MPAPVATITNKKAEQLRSGRSTPGSPAAFAASLDIEQADLLLRQTDQYAQWQRLRQKSDVDAQKLVPLLLARNTLLQESAQGKSINWQEFDRLTAQLAQSGIKLPSSLELQVEPQAPLAPASPPPAPPPSDVETTSPAAPAESLIQEENLLILNAVVPAVGLKQEVIGFGDGQTTLLPLGGIARTLDFALKVEAEKGVATGWFIDEDRTIALNAANRTITVAGKDYPWPDDKISLAEGDIYVDSKILSEWFPVDFAVSTGEMALTITPREKLPIQAQYEREQKRKGLQGKEDLSLKYPVKESPYELFSLPILDVSLGSRLTGGGDNNTDLQLTHALVGEGDLAHMGAKVFLSGDDQEPLDNASITLEKVDRASKMLGPMRASRVAVGDVSSVALPILGSSGVERGVAISNGDINRSRDFDTTRFEGNAQPGWDVELYQNGNLLDSFRVGGDGRYLFDAVPVYFGVNAFQVLALGPQGQRRMIETKNINVGSGMLKAGNSEYKLSATQQRDTVLGLDEDDTKREKGNPRLTGQFLYGLTDQLSVMAGLSSVEFDDTLHNYMQAGLSGTISSLYGEMNTIHDSAGGSGYSLQGQAALGPFNLRARHEIFSNFIDEDEPSKILKERTSVGLNGKVPELFLLPPLFYTLSKENNTYTDSENERYSARLSGRVQRVNLSNVLHWNDHKTDSPSDTEFDGEFQASGSIGQIRLITGFNYDLGENDEITQYKLSGLWPITRGVSAGANLTRDTRENETTTAKINLNLNTGKYTLTPSVSYDSEGNFGAFLGLSFSLGEDPVSEDMMITSEKRSGRGAATAFVYHDANNNKVFDQDEIPLPEVKVVARQARQDARTNEAGVAKFTSLSAHEPTEIAVDPDTLPDPFWQPSIAGMAVATRTGSVSRLEFPVVTTGEIDGTVFYETNEGAKEPLANVQLEIQDENGASVQTITSEYDGFYLFEKVFPGTYTLLVHSEDPKLKELTAGLQRELVIGNDGTIARGNDIVLRAPGSGSQSKSAPAPHPPTAAPLKSKPNNQAPGNAVTPSPVSSLNIRPLTILNDQLPTQINTPNPEAATIAEPSTTLPAPAEILAPPPPTHSISISPLAVLATLSPLPVQPKNNASQLKDEKRDAINKESRTIPLSVAPDRGGAAKTIPMGPPAESTSLNVHPPSPLTAQPNKDRMQSVETLDGTERLFGVHLASYKTMETAKLGVRTLAKRLAGIIDADALAIAKVDLGKEKGIYYRVTSGRFSHKEEADRLAGQLLSKLDYAKSIVVQTEMGLDKTTSALPVRSRQSGLNAQVIAGKYLAMQQRR